MGNTRSTTAAFVAEGPAGRRLACPPKALYSFGVKLLYDQR
jgi:hypothetical protein